MTLVREGTIARYQASGDGPNQLTFAEPGPGKLNRKEQEEGQSLGHAINALDIFMTDLREGYGDQSFFLFKNGHY